MRYLTWNVSECNWIWIEFLKFISRYDRIKDDHHVKLRICVPRGGPSLLLWQPNMPPLEFDHDIFSLLLVDLSIGWQWKCQQNCIVKKWRHPALFFRAVGTGGTGRETIAPSPNFRCDIGKTFPFKRLQITTCPSPPDFQAFLQPCCLSLYIRSKFLWLFNCIVLWISYVS